MEIFKIPLYYISFKKNDKLESYLEFKGFNYINHFKAIDGRKFKPKELLSKNLITVRTYNDLISEREQHSGIPSLGAIGCTMSHHILWKLCVEKNLPYIIICEDDLTALHINNEVIKKITNTLKKPKSIFVGSSVYRNLKNKGDVVNTTFVGLQFYIISNQACKELIRKTFPIDVQTDWYISHMDTIGKINVDGIPVSSQTAHLSLIQDPCIKCWLPTKTKIYIRIIICIFMLISLLIIWRVVTSKKLKQCNLELETCVSHSK